MDTRDTMVTRYVRTYDKRHTRDTLDTRDIWDKRYTRDIRNKRDIRHTRETADISVTRDTLK